MKLPHTKHAVFAAASAATLVLAGFLGGVALIVRYPFDPSFQAASVLPALAIEPKTISAKAAILFDPQDGRILYEKNAQESLPLASLTKLMTAEVVLTAESPDTPVTITADDLAPEGDWGFAVGDVVLLRDLLKMGLIASSNDAVQAAAASLGAGYLATMNQVAENLNLSSTHFNNPTGLDVDSSTSGAYSSAYDVAELAALFYKQYPSYFELTQEPTVAIQDGKKTLTAKATALPLLSIPGFIGAKTGYTDLAGGNLVAVFDIEIGHPLIAVVLGSTRDGRFTDIKTIIEAAQSPQIKKIP